jgi:hypothetical protein
MTYPRLVFSVYPALGVSPLCTNDPIIRLTLLSLEVLPRAELGQPFREIETISLWIQNCIEHHPNCSSESADSFLPTRLLDTKAFEQSQDLQLVELGGENIPVKYVALSHCWGPASKRPLTTTTENFVQHSQRISFHDLSLTFKDAIKLTKDLGHRYLWIDSLCIVQDKAEDWAREASRMSSVYGHALITLSALSSVDSTYGCRISNPQAITRDSRFFDFDTGPSRIRILEQGIKHWHEEYGDDTYRHGTYGKNPLRGRAWTLQERELSTRNIHFSENLVLWECNTLKASSQLPWHNAKPVDDHQPWPIRVFFEESLSLDGPLSVRDRWYELMEDYMSRSLTKGEDKLLALSGLAQRFQLRLPSSQYLAGIWTGHLPHALLWKTGLPRRYPDARRSTPWRAPSWSFLSLDGHISYESQRLRNYGGKRPEETPSDCGPVHLTVLDYHVQPKRADLYGDIGKAKLFLRGSIIDLRVRNVPLKDSEDCHISKDPWKALETSSGFTAGAVYFDVESESLHCGQVWFLPVCPDPTWSQIAIPQELLSFEDTSQQVITVMGLAIHKVEDTSNEFQRVGMVRWVDKLLLHNTASSDLVLV